MKALTPLSMCVLVGAFCLSPAQLSYPTTYGEGSYSTSEAYADIGGKVYVDSNPFQGFNGLNLTASTANSVNVSSLNVPGFSGMAEASGSVSDTATSSSYSVSMNETASSTITVTDPSASFWNLRAQTGQVDVAVINVNSGVYLLSGDSSSVFQTLVEVVNLDTSVQTKWYPTGSFSFDMHLTTGGAI